MAAPRGDTHTKLAEAAKEVRRWQANPVEALSDVLRMEVAGCGVKVSIVEPGFFKTGIDGRAREQAEVRTAGDESPYRTAYPQATKALDAIERLAPPRVPLRPRRGLSTYT